MNVSTLAVVVSARVAEVSTLRSRLNSSEQSWEEQQKKNTGEAPPDHTHNKLNPTHTVGKMKVQFTKEAHHLNRKKHLSPCHNKK